MVRPVGIESLAQRCPVTICLKAVVGRQEHEESFPDVCSVFYLLEHLPTVIRNCHGVDAVRRV